MKKQQFIGVLVNIAKLSANLRNKMISYGFSQSQIDSVLVGMLLKQSTQEESQLKLQSFNRGSNLNKLNTGAVSFKNQLEKLLTKQKKDIYIRLVSFVGQLQLEIASIEEYEQYWKVFQQQKLTIYTERSISSHDQSFKTSEKSIESHPSSSILSHFSKQSKQSSTQIESLQSQEAKLKKSLKGIIQKTRILRAMMERQFLLNTLEECSGYQPRRHSQFSRFENFMIE